MLTQVSDQDVTEQLKELYRKGLFKQGMTLGQSHYGDFRHWPGAELGILGTRFAIQLCLYRPAYAAVIRLYRKYPTNPRVCYYFLRVLLSTKGPYITWSAQVCL